MRREITILRIVFDFLDKCSDEEIDKLCSGEAKLKIDLPREKRDGNRNEDNFDYGKAISDITALNTIEEAREYFQNNSFTKSTLTELASRLDVRISKSDKNVRIIERIIESVVGSKLKFDGLLNMEIR